MQLLSLCNRHITISPILPIAIVLILFLCSTSAQQTGEKKKKNAGTTDGDNPDSKEYIDKLKQKQLVTRVVHKPDDCNILSEVGDELYVHYTGYLDNGKVFDTSEQGEKNPISFKLGSGQVIPGWEQGMQGMCQGERRRLVVPPSLAYGSAGFPPVIPPDATLMFQVHLVQLVKKTGLSMLTNPEEYFQLLKLLAAPAFVGYVCYYLYRQYMNETAKAKEMKRQSGSKKYSKRK
ncbi:unnamed protein product [Lymnaea stagnalis]|uniref:peptidylprolyl isomerase n=1 Tax=Lymnaea stagnalis TaxID=6523 RepID=A0AAV2HNV1_LYMST